jgi:hypothetical protein
MSILTRAICASRLTAANNQSTLPPGAISIRHHNEFYGIGVDSATTDEHVYWLTVGEQPGQRIQSIHAPANPTASTSFLSSVELKPRTIYFGGLRNGDKENFFGPVIARDPVDQALTLQHVDASSKNGAVVEVALQGVTLTGHRVEVQVKARAPGKWSSTGKTWVSRGYRLGSRYSGITPCGLCRSVVLRYHS